MASLYLAYDLSSVKGPHSTGKTGKMVPKIPCRGKHRDGNFAKTQRILFALVVNFLILNIQDIAIYAAKLSNFSKSVNF